MATRARSHSARVLKVSTIVQASVTGDPGPEVRVWAQSTQANAMRPPARAVSWHSPHGWCRVAARRQCPIARSDDRHRTVPATRECLARALLVCCRS